MFPSRGQVSDFSWKTNTDIHPIRRVDYLVRKQAGEEDTNRSFVSERVRWVRWREVGLQILEWNIFDG